MKFKIIYQLTIALLIALSITACSQETPQDTKHEPPPVNDENCKPGNIAKMEDNTAREAFAGACLRRGDFKPSTGKTW